MNQLLYNIDIILQNFSCSNPLLANRHAFQRRYNCPFDKFLVAVCIFRKWSQMTSKCGTHAVLYSIFSQMRLKLSLVIIIIIIIIMMMIMIIIIKRFLKCLYFFVVGSDINRAMTLISTWVKRFQTLKAWTGVEIFLLTFMPAKKGCWMATVSDQGLRGWFVNLALTLHVICKQKNKISTSKIT